jgi:pimeloyl-ACP methyl ester carboxylesterase
VKVLLLPGLDGTSELFESFVAATPPGFDVSPVRLPSDRPRGYLELTEFVMNSAPPGPFALVAESFSGPLALQVAARAARCRAVALCASFALDPVPGLLGRVPEWLWSRPPSLAVLRLLLTGGDRQLAEAVRRTIATVESGVMVARIKAAMRVDVTAELRTYDRPLLYLRATADRIVRAATARRLQALKPTMRVVDVEAPHLVLQTKPVEAWNHIAPFLERAMRVA